ncbi:MAG: AMP nucleosidase [Gammaproteobacteria bacterium]|nr:AMP nucleosidase [Gammaproteobacteria bacterium]
MSVIHLTPEPLPPRTFTDAEAAVDYLTEIYDRNTDFLCRAFDRYLAGELSTPTQSAAGTADQAVQKIRALYPEVSFVNPSYADVDSRLSYGYVIQPGEYSTTITRPGLYRRYLIDQLTLLMANHGQPMTVGESTIPIPVHFALNPQTSFHPSSEGVQVAGMRDIFDVPDIEHVNDYIVNGTYEPTEDLPIPLAPFPAQRIDYSLHRLLHYSATSPEHFQNFVLFTNYQFYVEEFCRLAHELMAAGDSAYTAFVEPGDVYTPSGESAPASGTPPERAPQMPAYHLVSGRNRGITLINIGVGPSNAKTITDHVAVLRPHAWLMLGHCAGLRNSQQLGDYVLAHAYVREDHVLDNDIPVWVPIPALAEIQQALESAVAETTGLDGFDLKKVMRTGTVASIDNRNWELQDHREPVRRLSQSRAIALDMESATIAANGFRLRVPYGTLLCISDKPLQGELKLPGMASRFYQQQVAQHLQIGILALQKLAAMDTEKLHSRKLRSFFETAFQ